MDKTKTNKYYQIAASGSRKINHPAMIILKGLADKADRILDLGCGEGTRLNWLTKKGTGVDINGKAISLAKKKYPGHNFLIGDLSKLPFSKGSFDLVYSAYVFEHLKKPEKAFKEAVKVLKKRGRLVIVAPNYGAPNRASPPFKGSRVVKLLSGFAGDFRKEKGFSWRKVAPIATKEKYDIDWDTTCEPYLKTLIDYLEEQKLRILYTDSCWSEELADAGVVQKIFRFLGTKKIFPFRWWGPHLIVVAEKSGAVVKCVFCKKKTFRTLFEIDHSIIEICVSCGLIRTNGLITADYKNYHRDSDYVRNEPLFKNIFGRVYRDVVKVIKGKGRVLEIGCSTGVLLGLFKQNGWEAWGIESSGAAKEAAKKGIKLINTVWKRAKIPEGYFDLIILNHTLEHMEDPVGLIAWACRYLKSGGKIFIGVPNAGSLSANLMKARWPYILPKEHRYHFYPQILRKILEANGFEVIFEKSRSGIFNWEHPVAGLIDELVHLKKNFIKDFLSIPGAMIANLLNRGTNLTVICKK
jgi:SAM-dependent methyltransferase